MRTLAPVIVFAYRRPDHLGKMLTSLMRCKGFEQSPVIVYCDGPRNTDETDSVMATRELARSMLGEHAEFHFRAVNLGLSGSVIAGVTDVVSRFGRAIVVEDDLELSTSFLTFMNQALDRYANDESVFQVSGYMFDVPILKDSPSALFLPFTSSWGWATWKRAWDQFDPQATGWQTLRKNDVLRRRFNLDGTYDYATMLFRQMAGFRDSWAIRWYWIVFKANGLVLFPPVSLVSNKGFDGSGTNGRGVFRQFSKTKLAQSSMEINQPKLVQLDADLYGYIKAAIWQQNGGWKTVIVDFIRRVLKN